MKQELEKRHCIGMRHPIEERNAYSKVSSMTGGPLTLKTAKRLASLKCKEWNNGKKLGYYAVIGWIENFDHVMDIDKKPLISAIYSNQSGKWETL